MSKFEHYAKSMAPGPEPGPEPQQNRVPLVDLELSKPPPSWVSQGLCAEYARRTGDYDFMFPVGKNGRGPKYRKQKAMCDQCPVKDKCLAYGKYEPFGMWGGKSARDRRQIGGGRGRLSVDGQIMTPPKGNKPEQE